MIELGTHWEYITGGYLASALVVAVMIGWVVVDARVQKRRVAALEAARNSRRAA